MALQPGNTVLIKDGTGTGAVKIAALRDVSISFGGEKVDVTNIDSSGMQELLASAGVSSVQVSGKGVISDGAIFGSLATRTINKSLDQYTMNFGSNKVLTAAGGWQVTKFDASGAYNKEQQYGLTLESSGSISVA
jgi:predicted secreted protein